MAYKSTSTPVNPSSKLLNEEDGVTIDKEMYQILVGRLIYLSHIRPDITFDMSSVSQFMY